MAVRSLDTEPGKLNKKLDLKTESDSESDSEALNQKLNQNPNQTPFWSTLSFRDLMNGTNKIKTNRSIGALY